MARALVATLSKSETEVGTIKSVAGSAVPDGYLECIGQTLNSVTNPEYANLYAVIGTTWGGTGPTDFQVPDLRNRYLRGDGTNSDGNGGDSVSVGAYQGDQNDEHTHDQDSHNHAQEAHYHAVFRNDSVTSAVAPGPTEYIARRFNTGVDTEDYYIAKSTSSGTPTGRNWDQTATNVAETATNQNSGGTEARPKSYGVKFIIKY